MCALLLHRVHANIPEHSPLRRYIKDTCWILHIAELDDIYPKLQGDDTPGAVDLFRSMSLEDLGVKRQLSVDELKTYYVGQDAVEDILSRRKSLKRNSTDQSVGASGSEAGKLSSRKWRKTSVKEPRGDAGEPELDIMGSAD